MKFLKAAGLVLAAFLLPSCSGDGGTQTSVSTPNIPTQGPTESAGKPTALHLTGATVTEGETANLNLSVTGGNGKALTVTWKTSDGQQIGTVTGVSTKTPKSIAVTTLDNHEVDGTRTLGVDVVASSGTTGATTHADIVINDNDVATPPPPPPPVMQTCPDGSVIPATDPCPIITPPPPPPPVVIPASLIVSPVSVTEGGTALVTVTLKDGDGKPVTLNYKTEGNGNGAVGGVDFTPVSGTATIDNKTPLVLSVKTIDDTIVENAETFFFKAWTANIPVVSGTITINDNDVVVTPPPPPPPPVTKTCPDGSVIPATSTCPVVTPPPPPPPTTQTCPDGSVIPVTSMCPMPPPSPAGWVDSPSLIGLPDAPVTGIDPTLGKVKSGLPPTNAPDTVGAFRFICGPAGVLADDPIMFPGQPGKSHLHQFYGNDSVNAYSTRASLLGSGKSTCSGPLNPLNRSGYWMPALLDGNGNVIRPDYTTVYYKRFPKDSIGCKPPYATACVKIPNGLVMISGWDATKPTATGQGFHYSCTKASGASIGGTAATIAAMMNQGCTAGWQLSLDLDFPECWDGKHLDSPNHRDHVAHALNATGFAGSVRCPSTHPYLMPVFRLHAGYTIQPGDDTSKWTLSSDPMFPGAPAGSTLHGDYMEAWDGAAKNEWTDNCIDRLMPLGTVSYGTANSGLPAGLGPVSCQGGNLGDGFSLTGAQQPPWGWSPIPLNLRLIPIASVPKTPVMP